MRRQSAFTLIEIIVTIVVVGIAAVALLNVFASVSRGSADPVIQQQATTIAEAYMEEIMLRAFNDPQGGETGNDEGESGRDEYDDVKDYNSLAVGPAADQFGNPVAALADYTVRVSVFDQALGGIASTDSVQVDVIVSHAAIADIRLSGFRTLYFGP